jgi:hypothetical protein
VLKDELYKLIVRDFIRRIEERTATLPQSARESARGLSTVTTASNGATAVFQGPPGPDGAKDERAAANANGRVLSSG